MSLSLTNRIGYLHQTGYRSAADALCEAAGLGVNSGKYWTPEASDIRYSVFEEYERTPVIGIDSWACNEPLAMHLFKCCKFFYFNPELNEVAKTLLVKELKALTNFEVDESVLGFAQDLGYKTQTDSSTLYYRSNIVELIAFLERNEEVYAL
jgi:hypothetical protein